MYKTKKKACERVGRKPEEVTLVAVSKMKPLSDIEELLEAGQLEYGENYVHRYIINVFLSNVNK